MWGAAWDTLRARRAESAPWRAAARPEPAAGPAGGRCACGGGCPACLLQRQPDDQEAPGAGGGAATAPAADDLTGPLTESEWARVTMWLSYGRVDDEELTADPDHNALLMAAPLFCTRRLRSGNLFGNEHPLLCVDAEDTRADSRVQALAAEVAAHGPVVHWPAVSADDRILHVMELLVNTHGFPVNGAAGLVGNLWAESHVMPSIAQGGTEAAPLRTRGFKGGKKDFTAEEVMSRDPATKKGPSKAGVGLAQWTSRERREGLFAHEFQGRKPGAAILFDMDAQVDYLVTELEDKYPDVHRKLINPGVSLNDAADDVVYRFEAPGSILDAAGKLRPRSDAAVQEVFRERRGFAKRAFDVFTAVHPSP